MLARTAAISCWRKATRERGSFSLIANCCRHALARTRTATPYGTTPSRWRVYQFHHQGENDRQPITALTGLTGLEPATSGVTDRHSNQLSYSPRPTVVGYQSSVID